MNLYIILQTITNLIDKDFTDDIVLSIKTNLLLLESAILREKINLKV